MSGLGRLAKLYSALEHARFVDLQRALLSVAEVEQAIARQEEIRSDCQTAGRTALQQEDQSAWMLAETRSTFAGWRRERLESLGQERQSLQRAAADQYRASHIESEQVHRLVEDAREQAAYVDERKVQVAADDRFLSRRHWMGTQSARLGGSGSWNE